MHLLASTVAALAALFSALCAILFTRYGLDVRARLCWGSALVAVVVITSQGNSLLHVSPMSLLCVLVIYAAIIEAAVGALRARWQRAWTMLAHSLVWGTHLVCDVFGASPWSIWLGGGMATGLMIFTAFAWLRWRAFQTAPAPPASSRTETYGEQTLVPAPRGSATNAFARED